MPAKQSKAASKKTARRKRAGQRTSTRASKKAGTTRRTRAAKLSESSNRAVPKGLSLHIGMNGVDPKHYAGWSGPLLACEQDAHDMAALAGSKKMRSTQLLTRAATRRAVLAGLRSAAKQLAAGDFFFLTYSGHGGQVPDRTEEEEDRNDETWCLYDGELIDDELYLELGRFAKGVRILVLSDSCHSGTVTRALFRTPVRDAEGQLGRPRLMPPEVAQATYQQNRKFYDGIQRRAAAEARQVNVVEPDVPTSRVIDDPRLAKVASRFQPSVILISGCQDNQESLDGDRNGAFTEQLLRVWKRGAFVGNYARFHEAIKAGMPRTQTPNLFTLGDVRTFLTQQPFQLSAKRGKRVTLASAREFLDATPLPSARRAAGSARTRAALTEGAGDTTSTALDAAKAQAAVVGADIISFVPGVTVERREAIINSSLLAQLVASRKVSDATRIDEWYNQYFEVLTNVGWVVQDRGFAEYKETGNNFEAHKAIIAVATTLLGAAPAALAIVTSTLEGLRSMNESSPWITIFDRESRSARAARFQIGLAEQDADGQFFVNLMAFSLEARTSMTQVLFFRAKRQDATLRHYSGRVTIDTSVLDGIREGLKTKLLDHALSYISLLPDIS
jgi:metacaspase-1